MAYLNNDQIRISAILTEVGREQIKQGNFWITKYALGDGEIDYTLTPKNIQRLRTLEPSTKELFTLNSAIKKRDLDITNSKVSVSPNIDTKLELNESGLRIEFTIFTYNYGTNEFYDIYSSDKSLLFVEGSRSPNGTEVNIVDNYNNPNSEESYFRVHGNTATIRILKPTFYAKPKTSDIYSSEVKRQEKVYYQKVATEGIDITFKIIGVSSGAKYERIINIR